MQEISETYFNVPPLPRARQVDVGVCETRVEFFPMQNTLCISGGAFAVNAGAAVTKLIWRYTFAKERKKYENVTASERASKSSPRKRIYVLILEYKTRAIR